MSSRDAGPLAGVTFLEFGHFIAAPFAGVVLADLGADVIKVEDPDWADEARQTGPHFLDGEYLHYLAQRYSNDSAPAGAAH